MDYVRFISWISSILFLCNYYKTPEMNCVKRVKTYIIKSAMIDTDFV